MSRWSALMPELSSSFEYESLSGNLRFPPAYPGNGRGKPKLWFVFDPAGMFCATLTVFLIGYAEFAVVVMNIAPWFEYRLTFGSLFFTLTFNLVLFMALWSHFSTMTSDPGSVPLPPPNYQVQETPLGAAPFEKFGEKVTVCRKCRYYKPIGAHHCSTCGRCVRKLDHHCPWVNNCVGESNQKNFLLFLLYIFLTAVYAILLVGLRIRHCTIAGMDACRMGENAMMETIVVAFLLFECILFGLFVVIMGCDQLNGIRRNQGGIDKLKGQMMADAGQSSFGFKLSQVFGGGKFRWSWFLPLPPPIPTPDWNV